MSLKKNILANYVSQIYVTLIGIVMVPFYVKYMGAEAYGLVGFFTMMQAWFQLLDMGLTPTMARATARYNGGVGDADNLRQLLRALEGVFVGVGLIGCVAMVAGAGKIANSWLKVETLPISEVQHAVMLMAVIVALRWVAGLYRGAVTGFECMVWLSGLNVATATARFVLVIPLFIFLGGRPIYFFSYQLIIAVFELALLVFKTYRLLPRRAQHGRLVYDWAPLRDVLKFSLSIAFTSSIWVLVTQTDKLVLSKLLPLGEYAYFTLAVLVAGGVSILSGPVSAAILPRLTNMAGADDERTLYRLYSQATQLVGIVTIPASFLLAFFPEHVLWAWTGNLDVALKAAPVLALYSLGNGILALAAFPYYLQYAKGDLKLHIIGNALFVVVLIPALIWATLKYGVLGAGYAWLGANSAYFLLWLPIIHRRLKKGLHTNWILRDIGVPALVSLAIGIAARQLVVWPQQRLGVALILVTIGLCLLAGAALGSGLIREKIKARFGVTGFGQARENE